MIVADVQVGISVGRGKQFATNSRANASTIRAQTE